MGAVPQGGTLTLRVVYGGPFARRVEVLLRRITEHCVGMEAAGLKVRREEASR